MLSASRGEATSQSSAGLRLRSRVEPFSPRTPVDACPAIRASRCVGVPDARVARRRGGGRALPQHRVSPALRGDLCALLVAQEPAASPGDTPSRKRLFLCTLEPLAGLPSHL